MSSKESDTTTLSLSLTLVGESETGTTSTSMMSTPTFSVAENGVCVTGSTSGVESLFALNQALRYTVSRHRTLRLND